ASTAALLCQPSVLIKERNSGRCARNFPETLARGAVSLTESVTATEGYEKAINNLVKTLGIFEKEGVPTTGDNLQARPSDAVAQNHRRADSEHGPIRWACTGAPHARLRARAYASDPSRRSMERPWSTSSQ